MSIDPDVEARFKVTEELLKSVLVDFGKKFETRFSQIGDETKKIVDSFKAREDAEKKELRDHLASHGYDYDKLDAEGVEAAIKSIEKGATKKADGSNGNAAAEIPPELQAKIRSLELTAQKLERENAKEKERREAAEKKARDDRRDSSLLAALSHADVPAIDSGGAATTS